MVNAKWIIIFHWHLNHVYKGNFSGEFYSYKGEMLALIIHIIGVSRSYKQYIYGCIFYE